MTERTTDGMTERWMAAALFAVVVLAFLARGLPPGRAPVAVGPLYGDGPEVPFEAVRPADFEPHNPYLSDQALAFYPMLHFMSAAVRGGELPLWTPHSGGGLPMIGNLSSAFFYPLSWLSFLPDEILGVSRGMLLSALIRLWLAGFFGFLFLRRIGLARVASVLGALGLMLFGYQTGWLFYSISNVACLLPLCLYLTQLFCERPSAGRSLLLSAALALQFLGGHAETSLALALAVIAWFLTAAREPGRLLPPFVMIGRFALAGLLALMLCAFQLLPFAEYLSLSQGRQNRLASAPPTFEVLAPFSAQGLSFGLGSLALLAFCGWLLRRDAGGPRALLFGAAAGGLSFVAILLLEQLGLRAQLLLLLEPDLFGSPLGGGYRGPEAYTDVNGGYVGAFALGLALLYLVAGRRRRLRWPFGLLLLLAWVLPGHIEPFHSLLRSVPPFDLTALTRLLPLSGLAISVLAAGACDELREAGGERFRRGVPRLFAALATLGGLLFLAPGLAGWGAAGSAESEPPHPEAARLLAPADGQVFRPEIDARGRGHLEIPCVIAVPPGVAQVKLRAGSGFLVSLATEPALREQGGQLESVWHATREQAGRYALQVELEHVAGGTSVGPRAVIVIDREPALTRAGLARLLAALLLLAGLVWWGIGRPVWLWLAPLAVGAELFLFGFDYNTYVPEEIVYPPTGLTDFLIQRQAEALETGAGPFRVLCENNILQPNMHYAYDLQVPRTYDQLENRDFQRFLLVLTGGRTNFTRYNHETIDYGSPLFALLNVRYVVTQAALDHLPDFRLVFEEGSGRVYENLAAWPRASILPEAVDGSGLTLPEALRYDPRRTALLDRPPPSPLGGTGRAVVKHYSLNRIELEVSTDGPALLLLTDNFFPGWQASVNDVEQEIYRAALCFRAVPVPAGPSRVVFRYRPWSFWIGVGLAALALALSCGVLLYRRLAASRSTPLRAR